MKNQEHIWRLIARKMAGEASQEELVELQKLLEKNPDIQYVMEILIDQWKHKDQKEQAREAFVWHLQRMKDKKQEEQNAEQAIWEIQSKKPRSILSFNSYGIFNNYLKVIWRNLHRSKSFSLINISGLALGMAAAILILLWVQNELSFDQFHEKKDRIYIMYNKVMHDGKIETWPGVPPPLASELKANYPQVEEVCRLNGVGPFIVTVGDRHFEALGQISDPGFLKIFSLPLAEGNVETALGSPRSIVITQKFAKKLFGNEEAMGKLIRIDSNADFKVSGVMKDFPNNTGFGFEYMVPWSYMKEVGWERSNWDNYSCPTFILLKPGVSEQTANDRFRKIIQAHVPKATNELFLHPISKWHLYSKFENGKIVGGGIDNVRLFSLIAAFILLIACINYMNLSTARSVKRAREVGIRKVVGSRKSSLIFRFLGESITVSLIAGIFSLILVQLTIGGFNWLTWKSLYVPYQSLYFWLEILGFALFTGIIAGSYPAFYLSTFKPIAVLKGTFKTAYNLVNLRKVLVVVQFSFAITFIICAIIIYRQIDYGRKRDPGYNRYHLAFAYVKGAMNKNYQLIKRDLLNSGAVTSVTRSNSPITYTWSMDDGYTWQGKDPKNERGITEFQADNDFLETTGMKLVDGRTINTNIYPTDSMAMLINETAAKMMAFKNPIGQTVKNKDKTWTIVGVVKDFVPKSFFYDADPTVIQGPRSWFGAVTFKMNGKRSISDNMKKIEAIFKQYNPDYPFSYRFVDEADAEKFEEERRMGIQAALFGGMAIFISCLGLFALAAYMAESRIKEIGVRKVLGASVAAITTLLSKDFLKLVVISFVIASPIAWWLMHAWLQEYEYRVNISWWIFCITGLISIIITAATVSYQSIKAALSNPVISLRAE